MRILSLVALAGMLSAGLSTAALAGTQSTLLSSGNFENRCDRNGGLLELIDEGAVCHAVGVSVACSFESIRADCRWDGRRLLVVDRLLGLPDAEALAGNGNGGQVKKKGGGGFQNPNLPLKSK